MTIDRRQLLLAYCARFVLIEGAIGMRGAIAKAEEMAASDPQYVRLQQFRHPARPAEQRRAMDPAAFFQLEKDNDAFRRFASDAHRKTYIDGGPLKLPAVDLYFIFKNPGAEVGRGVAGDVESRTKAIADWWGR